MLVVGIVPPLPRHFALSRSWRSCSSGGNPGGAKVFFSPDVRAAYTLYPLFRGEGNPARGIFKALRRELNRLLVSQNRRTLADMAKVEDRRGWHSLSLTRITTRESERHGRKIMRVLRLVKKIFSPPRSLNSVHAGEIMNF